MEENLLEDVLVALRRIMRAIDLHSRSLISSYGLTVPQLMVLKELAGKGELAVGRLSRGVHLSPATVTSIVGRLTARGLVARERSSDDRRCVLIGLTPAGKHMVENAPGLLQDHFVQEFERLQVCERKLILSTLQRLVAMMDVVMMDADELVVEAVLAANGAEEP